MTAGLQTGRPEQGYTQQKAADELWGCMRMTIMTWMKKRGLIKSI